MLGGSDRGRPLGLLVLLVLVVAELAVQLLLPPLSSLAVASPPPCLHRTAPLFPS